MVQRPYLSQRYEPILLCLRSLTSTRGLATKVGKLSVGLVKDSMLLVEGHRSRVFVRIAMKTTLAANDLADWCGMYITMPIGRLFTSRALHL